MHKRVDEALLSASGLSIELDGRTILSDINLTVQKGERLAILGKSGAGKSTLLRGLVGFPVASSGDLFLFGTAIASLSNQEKKRTRQKVGHISQGFDLVDELSGLENVLLGAFSQFVVPRLWSFTYPKKTRDRAKELMHDLGLEAKSHQPARSLSGGERQRVAIARSLMGEPKMIFADEPVSALDIHSSQIVLDELKGVSQTGVAIVAAMHQVDLALGWAKNILVLFEGAVVAHGPAENFTREEISRLIGNPSGSI